MAISRAQLVSELEPGLNALFGLEYKNYENQHTQIYTIESSDRAFESLLQEWVAIDDVKNAVVNNVRLIRRGCQANTLWANLMKE